MYILLIIEKPSDYRELLKWEAVIEGVKNISDKNTSIDMLAENVLLIQATHTLHLLSRICVCVEKIPYRYTILSEAPKWEKSTPQSND